MFHQPESSLQHVFRLVHNWWSYLKPRLTPELVLYAVASLIGGVAISYGGWRVATAGVIDYQTSSPADSVTTPSIPSSPQVVVEVAGAVEKPGVYALPIGSRVAQALTEAGNPTSDADHTFLAKNINLAQELTDQQKLYVPFWLEDGVSAPSLVSEAGGIDGLELKPEQQIGNLSINTASLNQLMELEGIGEKRANDIIVGRPYLSLNDLLDKKILTESQWQKIKGNISL